MRAKIEDKEDKASGCQPLAYKMREHGVLATQRAGYGKETLTDTTEK